MPSRRYIRKQVYKVLNKQEETKYIDIKESASPGNNEVSTELELNAANGTTFICCTSRGSGDLAERLGDEIYPKGLFVNISYFFSTEGTFDPDTRRRYRFMCVQLHTQSNASPGNYVGAILTAPTEINSTYKHDQSHNYTVLYDSGVQHLDVSGKYGPSRHHQFTIPLYKKLRNPQVQYNGSSSTDSQGMIVWIHWSDTEALATPTVECDSFMRLTYKEV